MFSRKKILRLHEIDATGVLFFAQQFKIAQETFEEFLGDFGELLKRGDYLFPIVHAKGDFLSPIVVGDEMMITLSLEKMGKTSLTLHCRFEEAKSGKLLGTTSIVHVVIDRKTWTKTEIPEFLRTRLCRT